MRVAGLSKKVVETNDDEMKVPTSMRELSNALRFVLGNPIKSFTGSLVYRVLKSDELDRTVSGIRRVINRRKLVTVISW